MIFFRLPTCWFSDLHIIKIAFSVDTSTDKRSDSDPDLHVFTLKLFALKNGFFYFFLPRKSEKKASKVAQNRPKPFFSQSSPANSPELIFHIIKYREQASVLFSVDTSDGNYT